MRWWNKEIGALQFTQSPWWRLGIWAIALTIVAPAVSDYFVRRYDPNRIVYDAPQSNVPVSIPSTAELSENREYDTHTEIVVNMKDTPIQESTPHWDWEGDTETKNSIEYDRDNQPDNSLTLNEIDELEIELMERDTERLLKKSAKIRSQAQEMVNHSMPILAEQLNKMSIDEQRRFLAKMKATMTDYFPPKLQELAEEDPTVVREGWKSFIEQLQENGFNPPD